MIRSAMKLLACLTALSTAACVGIIDDEPPDEGDEGAGAPSLPGDAVPYKGCIAPGCSEQGRHLLSAVFDTETAYLSFPLEGKRGTSTIRLKVMGSALVRANGGALPLPLTITGTQGVLVINSVVAPQPGEPGPQYDLDYTTNGGTTANPCVNSLAIVLDGEFDSTAHHVESSAGTSMSFACKDEGVAYKCVNWGYPPGSNPMADGWRAHQVCTRAARADYCKNGKPHTLDETYVRIWDDYDVPALGFAHWPPSFQGLNQWPPPVNVFKFESVWPEEETRPPTCLSKTRWQGLKPGELDTCAVHPADPRTDKNATFCEGSVPDHPSHAIVFESKYTDLLLEEWVEGDDHAVTVTGYHPGDVSTVPGKRPFAATTGWTTHVQTLGTLIRSLPGSIEDSQVMNVYSYDDGGTDHVLAGPTGSAWTPPFSGTMTWEGKVFVNPPENGIPPTAALHAYQSATGDFYNGLAPSVSGDADQGIIGYIIAPAQ